MVPEDRSTPESSDPVSPDLMAQFDQWRRSDPVPGDSVEGSLEAESLALQRVRRTRKIRWFTLVVVATLSTMGLWGARMDLAYFFSPDAPIQLGDLRRNYVEGRTELPAGSNRHVEADGLIMTLVHDSNKYRFFFCPLYNLLVRTEQDLRLPLNRTYYEIDEVDEKLLMARMALIWELALRVHVKGRLLALEEVSGRWDPVWRHFAPDLPEVERATVHVLLDGGSEDDERPGAYLLHFLTLLASFALVGMSAFLYRRARRSETEMIAALADPSD